MQNWKKAVIFGSVGAGAILFFTGRRSIGTAVAAGGLAVLASEYPEKFEDIWENAPEYLQRGTQIFATLQKIGERFAEAAEERGAEAWDQIREYGHAAAEADGDQGQSERDALHGAVSSHGSTNPTSPVVATFT